jgi:hypothetical protein
VSKPRYPTFHITFARIAYDVECRVFPPRAEAHVGPDSPRYLDPGSPLRVVIIRILRDRVEMSGNDLLPSTRRAIADLVERETVAQFCRSRRAKGRAPAFCAEEAPGIPLAADETGQLRLVEENR